VELVDARDDGHIWGAQYTRNPAELATVQERIAREISDRLSVPMSSEVERRMSRRKTENADAYRLYLKGRYYFNKLSLEGVQKGIDHLQKAIEIDENFALAHAALGDCYNYLGKRPEARQALQNALALDNTLGEARASLGFFKFIYDWDFAGAEQEFKQALEMNPNYAEAHHWSAIFLANLSRHNEAALAAQRAVELDPLSLLMNMTLGLTAYLARDYKRAVEELLKVIEMDASFVAAHSVLGNVYIQQGRYNEAMREYAKVLELARGASVIETSMKAVIAHAYAKSGEKDKALKLLEELIELVHARDVSTDGSNPVDGLSLHSLAEIYAALEQKDQAFEWLNRAYEEHDMQLVSLKVNPTLDPLRSDPRFKELVERMGFPI
jgi:tetratricopeptide (TPR) repeat protein